MSAFETRLYHVVSPPSIRLGRVVLCKSFLISLTYSVNVCANAWLRFVPHRFKTLPRSRRIESRSSRFNPKPAHLPPPRARATPAPPLPEPTEQLGVGKLGDGEGPAVLLPRPVVGTFSKPVTGGALTTPPPSAADAKNGNNDTSAVTSPPTAKSDPADATAAAMAAATATAATGATTAAAAGGDGGSGSGGGAVGGATPPVFLATRAACGQSHTVLVSAAGEVWATGRNRAGQLGVNPEEVAETPVPVAVPFLLQDDSRAAAREGGEGQTGGGGEGGGGATVAVQAAAGRAHTLVLLSDGRVVGFGSDEFGALGAPPPAPASSEAGDGPGADSGMEVDDPPPMPPSYHWRPAVVEELKDQRITSVSAGGEQSLALAVDPVPAVAAESAAASPPRPQASPPRPPAAEAQHGVAAPTDASVGSALSAGEQKSAAAAAAPALVGGTSTATPSTEGATGGGDGEGDGVEGAGAGSGGAPISRQGSQAMYLRRRFSLPPALRMRTVGEFLQLVRRAAAAGVGKAGEGEAPQGVAEEAAVLEVGCLGLSRNARRCRVGLDYQILCQCAEAFGAINVLPYL